MIETPLKWVGGKGRIAEFIHQNAPDNFLNYHEPFLGSGAVFLYFKQNYSGRRHWNLSDANPHLICWWQAVQNDVHKLIQKLELIKERYELGDCKENYRTLRREFNEYQSLDTNKAALFMFLCRTAFNGLVRYNSKGEFNSAWGNQRTGQHKNTFVISSDHLLNLHEILQDDISFSCVSYEKTEMQHGDFGFFDPPYVPTGNRKIDTLAYCKEGFDENDQRKFSQWCSQQNASLMVCNHDTQFVRELFPSFRFVPYSLMKHFSGVGSARAKTPEVLICNYG